MPALAAFQADRYRASEVEAGFTDSGKWSPRISKLDVALFLQIDSRIENKWNIFTEPWACLQKRNILRRGVRCNSSCLSKERALPSGINRFNLNGALLTSLYSKIMFTVRLRKTWL